MGDNGRWGGRIIRGLVGWYDEMNRGDSVATNKLLAMMINDIILQPMRVKGTKYDSIDELPTDALPISVFYRKYGKKFGVSSPAYTYVKYDRHKFGYTSNAGTQLKAADPGYTIVAYYGTCYVINYQ